MLLKFYIQKNLTSENLKLICLQHTRQASRVFPDAQIGGFYFMDEL